MARTRARQGCSTGLVAAQLLVALALLAGPAWATDTLLVPWGATWRFLDDGSNQGTAWRAPGFDDSTWASGPAVLGYGEPNVVTTLGYGPDPNAKYVTSYFRLAFEVPDPGLFASAIVRLLRDDGGAVYLNGSEVLRSNLPPFPFPVGYTTPASTGTEQAIESATLPAALLVAGTNVLSVEVHQASGASSDLVLDLELVANEEPFLPLLRRGPYLQTATPDSVLLRWRTDFAADSRVRYGPSPTQLDTTVDLPGPTTEHEVELTGLSPQTPYYYAIGTSLGDIAGGDAEHRFRTAPLLGTRTPLRIWAVGDSGAGGSSAGAVRDAYLAYPGNDATDVWLLLGDNAYTAGQDWEYQTAFFNVFPLLLRRTPVWSTFGNHEGLSASSPTQSGPYYDMFSLPRFGEAGGLGSGTEAYYSFDHGNVHFICLDSQGTDRSPTGDMAQWLEADLAATTQDWILAFWHHPAYSKGSHNSDTELQLIQMRENLVPILEAGGVDLVLAGHSHAYERSMLLDGHYGDSSTLAGAMLLDAGDGDPAGDGAYEKPVLGPTEHEGAVYTVAGSGSLLGGGSLDHPAMVLSLNVLGSLVMDVDSNELEARFLDSTGTVQDSFAIHKPIPGAPACSDGVDNDRDGFEDHPADPGCDDPSDGSERSPALVCDDEVDQDGDSHAAFPQDPGCDAAGDPTESSPLLPCDDGLNNDSDAWIDYPADPGCRDLLFEKEDPQCQDGISNDGDGRIDFDGGASAGVPPAQQTVPDNQCSQAWIDREKKPSNGCGMGFELALLLPALAALRRRVAEGSRRRASVELPAASRA